MNYYSFYSEYYLILCSKHTKMEQITKILSLSKKQRRCSIGFAVVLKGLFNLISV